MAREGYTGDLYIPDSYLVKVFKSWLLAFNFYWCFTRYTSFIFW